MRGLVPGLAIAAASLVFCGSAQAEKKVALVIGNAVYRSVPALANPGNDAGEMGNALARLGFAVTRLNDASYDRMRRALLEFGRQARGAEMAVVFFAGHGIEVGGENWLIPIDAELKSDTDVEHEALGLKGVMLTVESASKLGLVILDACRNNPFAAKMTRTVRTRSVAGGLVQVEPNANVLVAYSAKDGTLAADGTGRNSPFTTALLRHIETPGLEINFLFRNVRDDVMRATNREQQPFVYGSLSREAIYLKPATAVSPLPPSMSSPALPTPTPELDLAFWNSIKESTSIGEFESYLKIYPNGVFAPLARLRIDELKRKVVAPERITTTPPGPAPKGRKCFDFQGRQFCE
jgi:uncharacterized caspase-like protein